MSDQIPRRIRLDLATPPEVAIRAAMAAVEAMGCDRDLTEAGTLLSRALNMVAFVVDRRLAECQAAEVIDVAHKCVVGGCQEPRAALSSSETSQYCESHRKC
jgi:hypothetical protein